MLRSLLMFCFVACLAASAQSKDLQVSTQTSFQPVTVTATVTLPAADGLVQLSQRDAAAAPAKVVFHWGEKTASGSLIYSEAAWKAGSMTASVQHIYTKPGKYGVMATVLDTKGRLIIQRGILIAVHEAVETPEPTN